MFEVYVATLIVSFVIAVTDKEVGIIYAICGVQCSTIEQWAILTFAGMIYYVYHVVASAIKG